MQNLNKTALYNEMEKVGGKMVDFFGWALPIHFGSILAEHKIVREHCGIFDVSHMGQIFVEGKDAYKFIQLINTNNVKNEAGRGAYSHIPNDNGGIIDDVINFCLSEEKFLIIVNASTQEKDFEWFNKKGGAHFIVNEKLRGKLDDFSRNTYHYVSVTHFQKLINAQGYVDVVIKEMGRCDFYYSYNIPIKTNSAQIKWFHLSNVLPFVAMSIFNIPYRRRIELWWLGILVKQGFRYSDFVSAESRFSLQLLSLEGNKKLLVSANGADQEIGLISSFSSNNVVKNIAVIIGTYHHKNLIDSYKIYRHLKANNNELKLVIIGDIDTIPFSIKNDPQVEIKGIVSHEKIINILSSAKFYINTSKVENSWNAASEGVFLAKESFVSKIPYFVLNSIEAITFFFSASLFKSIFVIISPLITKNDFSLIIFPAFLIAPPVPNGVFSIENFTLIPIFFNSCAVISVIDCMCLEEVPLATII